MALFGLHHLNWPAHTPVIKTDNPAELTEAEKDELISIFAHYMRLMDRLSVPVMGEDTRIDLAFATGRLELGREVVRSLDEFVAIHEAAMKTAVRNWTYCSIHKEMEELVNRVEDICDHVVEAELEEPTLKGVQVK